ncbi:probable E3 ubiquitin-protein ligase HIP1 [Solanum dulcamara]|uniref:probable E3 ubiquitin-protein ligase HIP1 n=1 Tax=Solanum dulcamara TaxID=45834 RepID=UPI0024857FB6|nr:probable E3 ubiquitin-protein ligase HIP1 [Solanum dulcamara]
MSQDQQDPPTILPHDQTSEGINNNNEVQQPRRVRFTIIRLQLYAQSVSVLDEVDDHEENYNEFLDHDNDDDDDVSEYLKTRIYNTPTKDIGDDVVVEEQEACSICLVEYRDNEDNIGTLKCGHEFHLECIKKWLMRKKTCPFCRALVLPTYDYID